MNEIKYIHKHLFRIYIRDSKNLGPNTGPAHVLVGLNHNDHLDHSWTLMTIPGSKKENRLAAHQGNIPYKITILPLATRPINTHMPTSGKRAEILRGHLSRIIYTKRYLLYSLKSIHSVFSAFSAVSIFWDPTLIWPSGRHFLNPNMGLPYLGV